MTLTLKALGTPNRWRLIYLDCKTGINLKGSVEEQELRLQPSLVWCWQGDRDKLKVEITGVLNWNLSACLSLIPVLTAGWGHLITER